MSTTGYLLLHGLHNRRFPDHWLRHLAGALRRDGAPVAYPQLPVPDEPVLDDWLDVVVAELELLREGGAEQLVVVGHSLGAITWLHGCARRVVRADRVLLAAPPGADELAREIPAFALPALTPHEVGAAAPQTRLVGSDADEWCAAGFDAAYATALRLELDTLPGAGHLSRDDGFGYWPSVIGWARDPSTRLVDDRPCAGCP